MLKRIVKSMALALFGVLLALPAAAQVRADLGPLHVRIATDPPPRPRYERREHRPDRDAVWIGGCWDWQDGRWVWLSGHWDHRPDRASRWISPRYLREGGAWRYEPGHWSNQELTEGDDYRHWRDEHHSDRDHRGDHEGDREGSREGRSEGDRPRD